MVVTYMQVSKLSARFYMNSKQSMVLLVTPSRFAYLWYAFNVHVASKPNHTFSIQLFVLMALQISMQPKASLFSQLIAL